MNFPYYCNTIYLITLPHKDNNDLTHKDNAVLTLPHKDHTDPVHHLTMITPSLVYLIRSALMLAYLICESVYHSRNSRQDDMSTLARHYSKGNVICVQQGQIHACQVIVLWRLYIYYLPCNRNLRSVILCMLDFSNANLRLMY